MKKKIISLAAVAIVAVAAVVGVSKNANEVEFSDLALANIEALANGEGGIDGWRCFRYSYDDGSSFFFTYTRCMDCYTSSAVSVWQQETCWH